MSLDSLAQKSLQFTDKKLGLHDRDLDERVPFYTLEEVKKGKNAKRAYSFSALPLFASAAGSVAGVVSNAIGSVDNSIHAIANYMDGPIWLANQQLTSSAIDAIQVGAYMALASFSFNLARRVLRRVDILSQKLEDYELDEGAVEELLGKAENKGGSQ